MEGSMRENDEHDSEQSVQQKYTEGFFDDLIGHLVHVDCSSWHSVFAEETWGLDYETKTTIGEIRQVRQNRQTGAPKFNIHFEDIKQTYTNLDLDYVLTYSPEVPVKYHQLKAEFIVRLSRAASAIPKKPTAKGKAKESTVLPTVTATESESSVKQASKSKRGGHERVLMGKAKKTKDTQILQRRPGQMRMMSIWTIWSSVIWIHKILTPAVLILTPMVVVIMLKFRRIWQKWTKLMRTL
jgi:hypothetical protein